MAKVQIILPAMGEGIIEAEITRWLVKEGQAVEADDPVVEIATDKVDSEIPAPASGTLQKILVSEGETSKIGQVIALLSTVTAGSESPEQELARDDTTPPERTDRRLPDGKLSDGRLPESDLLNGSLHPAALADVSFLSPVVRKIAREQGIDSREISGIRGSGVGGRITRRDIEDYLKSKTKIRIQPEDTPHSGEKPPEGSTTVMGKMRQKIADHMVYSKKTAPHVTSFVESDVTEMVDWRNRIKEDFALKYGQKLTITTLVIEAVVKALKEYPDINVSVNGQTIIHKKDLNIGMATALPDGNLIVPVIRQADRLSLPGLAAMVNELALKARTGSLKPEDATGGSFTITNLGNFGNLTGTPIINQPEVAILAVGAIRRMPAVVKIQGGEAIGIRQMMMLSLAYDHRVVDGALGGSFLQSIGNHLQHFDHKGTI